MLVEHLKGVIGRQIVVRSKVAFMAVEASAPATLMLIFKHQIDRFNGWI